MPRLVKRSRLKPTPKSGSQNHGTIESPFRGLLQCSPGIYARAGARTPRAGGRGSYGSIGSALVKGDVVDDDVRVGIGQIPEDVDLQRLTLPIRMGAEDLLPSPAPLRSARRCVHMQPASIRLDNPNVEARERVVQGVGDLEFISEREVAALRLCGRSLGDQTPS